MRRHPFLMFGWLIVATVLLSLIGLTAKPLPVVKADTQAIAQVVDDV